MHETRPLEMSVYFKLNQELFDWNDWINLIILRFEHLKTKTGFFWNQMQFD